MAGEAADPGVSVSKTSVFLVFCLAAALLTGLIGCSSANQLLARAESLQSQGHFASALALYQQLLDRTPAGENHRRSELYLRVADCESQLDRIPEAFHAIQRAEESDPGNITAHLRLGEYYLAGGASERAREQAEFVLRSGGHDPDALALIGSAWAASGQHELAEEAYQRVLHLEPGRVNVALALADIYNQDDQIEEARHVLYEVASAQPRSSQPWVALGRLAEQQGDGASAEENYRRAIAAEDTAETNLRLAQFLQRTARINEAEQVLRHIDSLPDSEATALPDFQLLSGDVPAAVQGYQKVLDDTRQKQTQRLPAPQHGQLAAQRARLVSRLAEADLGQADANAGSEHQAAIERARRRLDEFRSDLDAASISILNAEIALADANLPLAAIYAGGAVSLAPDSASAHYVLGQVKYRSGQRDEARKEWEDALDYDSHFVPARLDLGQLALEAHDAKQAEHYVIEAVRDEPGNVRALTLFASVLAGQGRNDVAAVIARRALALESSSPDAHIVLGRVALAQEHLAEALVQFEHALLLQPHSSDAIAGLAAVYRRGDFSRAMLRKMERQASAPPASATLMEIAGLLYQQHGWRADAERCLEQALRIDPSRSTAAGALAKLQASSGHLDSAASSLAAADTQSAVLLEAIRAEDQNRLDQAIAGYERAVRQGDQTGVASNNLAWLYAERGQDLGRALSLAQKAAEQAPENPAVLDTLGMVHLQMRQYSNAISALKNAHELALRQGHSESDRELLREIRQHLSVAYLRAGQPERAELIARNLGSTAGLQN